MDSGATAWIPAQAIARVVKHSPVGGELLQRANFSRCANDRYQIIRLKLFVDELADLIARDCDALE